MKQLNALGAARRQFFRGPPLRGLRPLLLPASIADDLLDIHHNDLYIAAAHPPPPGFPYFAGDLDFQLLLY